MSLVAVASCGPSLRVYSPPFLARAGVRGIALLIKSFNLGPAVIAAALLISVHRGFSLPSGLTVCHP